MSSTSVGSFSPGKRHSQIPVLSRFNPNLQRVRAKKGVASIDMISPGSFTHHNRTRPPSNAIAIESRSNSPLLEKQTSHRGKLPNGRSKFSCMGNPDVKSKPAGISERSRKSDSVKKDISKNGVNYTKSNTTITLSPSPGAEGSDRGSRHQISVTYSKKGEYGFAEELSQPGEGNNSDPSEISGKTSSNKETRPFGSPGYSGSLASGIQSETSDINKINEGGPHLELSHLSANDDGSLINGTVPIGANSPTGETADGSHGEDESRVAGGARGAASGDELAISPSIRFEIDNDPRESRSGISGGRARGALGLIDDDANEYDSGETTDVDEPGGRKYADSENGSQRCVAHLGKTEKNNTGAENEAERGHAVSKSIRSGMENEILTDVSYRQFVYHPTVLRRRTRDRHRDGREVPGAESLRHGATSKLGEKGERSIKTSFRENIHPTYVSDRDVNITPLRAWSDKNPGHDDTQIYDLSHMMGNAGYVFKDIKRERTKREEMTGAVLKITAKFIHLLAMLNLWPGDSCQLLTSHSIRFGR